MTSTSETGHAKNVANYERLIAEVTALGVTYNPAKANLKLPALNTQLTAAKAAVTAVNAAEPAYKIASNARDASFAPVLKTCTRVINALKASDTSDQTKADAMTLIRKLRGTRATAKKTEAEKSAAAAGGKAIVEVSSSQMSFDSRLDNLDKLIKLLASVAAYAPNEADLKVTALTTVYNDLKTRHSAVTAAEMPLVNARIARNDVLYKPLTGLVDTSVDVKTYIKSVFGASGPQYKQVTKLVFKAV